jgi:hypothetical protein
MNDINTCGNHESLVTYLYDECEPAERQSMAAHVAVCASCAEELQALRDARVHLAAWSPPALPLGFQITRTENDQPSKVLRPATWWRQPLPAWAQAAAAAVIFAAGMSLGAARSPETPRSPAVALAPAAVSNAQVANTASRDDLQRLEARLRTMESAAQVDVPRTVSGSIDERALLRRVADAVDARIRMSEQENIRVLASAGRSLEDYRAEQAARMDEIEREQEDIRQAVSRGLGSYQVVRAASLSNVGP